MSVNAVGGVTQASQKLAQPPVVSPSRGVTPFGQQLNDVQAAQTLAAHGHHHPHAAGSQSAGKAPASAGGVTHAPVTTAGALLNLVA